jgi:hypothetical protein
MHHHMMPTTPSSPPYLYHLYDACSFQTFTFVFLGGMFASRPKMPSESAETELGGPGPGGGGGPPWG